MAENDHNMHQTLMVSVVCAWMFIIMVEKLKSAEAQGLDVLSTQLPCPGAQRPPDK
jgi:hypothetical protein